MNNLFKQNFIRQNIKITKKLFVHHYWYSFKVNLLYIISFCFDPHFEALVRFLQCFVHIGECRFDRARPGEMIRWDISCWSFVQWCSTRSSPSNSNLNCSKAKILWIKTFPYYSTASFELRRAFVEFLSHRI